MSARTFEHVTAVIVAPSGDPVRVEAVAPVGALVWCVHRSLPIGDRWQVRHVPTGMHVGATFRTRRDALALARTLETIAGPGTDITDRALLERVKIARDNAVVGWERCS